MTGANIVFTPYCLALLLSNGTNIKNVATRLGHSQLKTTKSNKDIHGFGIKSIKRIDKEYIGNINYSFDENTMVFTFNVVLNKSK